MPFCDDEMNQKMNALGMLHYLAHKVNTGQPLTEGDHKDFRTTRCLFVRCDRPTQLHGKQGKDNRECPLTNTQCIYLEKESTRHVIESMKKHMATHEEEK